MPSFLKLVDRINFWVGHTFCYLLLFMSASGVYEVIMRYVFNRPTKWVWELNGFFLCVLVSLGAGFALYTETHVKVDFLYNCLSERRKALLDVFSSFFMFLFLGVLLFQTGKMSLMSLKHLERSHSFFGPPLYPFKMLLTAGIFLFLLQGIAGFIRSFYTAVTGKNLTRENV